MQFLNVDVGRLSVSNNCNKTPMDSPKYKLGDVVYFEHTFSEIKRGVITCVRDEPCDYGLWWYDIVKVADDVVILTPEVDIKYSEVQMLQDIENVANV